MPATLVHSIPDANGVARTLSGLCGKSANCRGGKPFGPAPRSPVVVASYVEAGNKLAAVLVMDLGLAASVGAALVMLPPVMAQECLKTGKITDNIDENMREVLNVCATMFNSSNTPRVTLGSVITVEKLPEAIASFVKASAAKLDVEVTLPTYPGGKLSLFSS
jgi:hypothetical protein